MQIRVRIFDVYETEGGGSRPSWLWIPGFSLVFLALAYFGKLLELMLAGVVAAREAALAWAIAKTLIFFGLLCVGWMGITVTHLERSAGFYNAGVLDIVKDRQMARHYPDLSTEMQPNKTAFEAVSPAPVGIVIQVGRSREFVPNLTPDKLARLVEHLDSNGNKLTFSLYYKTDASDRNPWQRATVAQFRRWLIQKQWAAVGERNTVIVRPEVARALKSEWVSLSRGY